MIAYFLYNDCYLIFHPKTLAGTVQRDPIAPHYKYHDDPYLIPMSNMGKRTFALAKESGKKAAKWIRNKHSNFFQHRVAEPFIEVRNLE